MAYNIAFYIHHHGSGHVMRALAIAAQLNKPVTFLGSGLREYQHKIPPDIQCIHLPADVPGAEDTSFNEGAPLDCLHYAPLNVQGIRLRNKLLSDFFLISYPMLLIVDVSVEITLFARLCGIPTIVVRQHGYRTDPAHLAAYQSASLLLAPYSALLSSETPAWIDDKTFFSGGFSKYTGLGRTTPTINKMNHVAVMTGSGGTSIDMPFVRHLAKTCPRYHFHIIGNISKPDLPIENITFYGICNDAEPILNLCYTVIGNAGHNTVMEIADLQKVFICIPEERPFDEQLQKALLLKQHYGIPLVTPAELFEIDWNILLEDCCAKSPNWDGMINGQAYDGIAKAVDQVATQLFNCDRLSF